MTGTSGDIVKGCDFVFYTSPCLVHQMFSGSASSSLSFMEVQSGDSVKNTSHDLDEGNHIAKNSMPNTILQRGKLLG